MPDLTPLMNYGALGVFMLYVLWGIDRACKAYWPVHKARMEAQQKKIEKDSELADSLKVTTENQCGLMERLVQMADSNTQTLGQHGVILGRHETLLTELHAGLKDGLKDAKCKHEGKP